MTATNGRSVANLFKAAAVSCFGLGYAPVASGTFGTLGAVGIVGLLYPLRHQPWFHFGGAMAVLILVGLAAGIPLGNWAEKYYGKKDPGQVVLDELLGFWICIAWRTSGFPGWRELVVAFFAFRLFDVVKPWPARRFEELPGGTGVMLDDLVAGLYAAMLVVAVREWLQWP